jgi:predicted transcriptional regulator
LTSNKRSKVDIYSAILDSLCEEGGKIGKASPTRVAHKANIPYDRFQRILDHFVELGMVHKTDNGLIITEKGLKCRFEIQKTNQFLRRMGLAI